MRRLETLCAANQSYINGTKYFKIFLGLSLGPNGIFFLDDLQCNPEYIDSAVKYHCAFHVSVHGISI